MRLKKGDTVVILTGKDRTKQGKILEVSSSTDRLVVDGLNLRTKNVRPRRQNEKGQRVQFSAPMHASNVQLVCPKCGKPTRLGVLKDGERRHRMCRLCKQPV